MPETVNSLLASNAAESAEPQRRAIFKTCISALNSSAGERLHTQVSKEIIGKLLFEVSPLHGPLENVLSHLLLGYKTHCVSTGGQASRGDAHNSGRTAHQGTEGRPPSSPGAIPEASLCHLQQEDHPLSQRQALTPHPPSVTSHPPVPSTENGMRGTVEGPVQKGHLLNSLCGCRWDTACVQHVAHMCQEIPMDTEELEFLINKILRCVARERHF